MVHQNVSNYTLLTYYMPIMLFENNNNSCDYQECLALPFALCHEQAPTYEVDMFHSPFKGYKGGKYLL